MDRELGGRRAEGRGDAVDPISRGPEAELRALARQLRCDGRAPLTPRLGERRRLERALADARRTAACGAEPESGLRRLAEEAPRIAACAERARDEGGLRLPARRGVPRVRSIAEALVCAGEHPLTAPELLAGLRAFDAVRPLKQAELWAVPEALRIALTAACGEIAASIVRDARASEAAARWMRHPSRRLRGRSDAFFERALMRCGESGRADLRERLEAALQRAGERPERVIRRAHDARAFDLLQLDNLMAVCRLLDALDWEACFETLSPVEAELREDPSGVYPRMDADSRRALREEVAVIARRAGLSERAVARGAVLAARAPGGIGPKALSGGACWWLWDDAGRRALLARLDRPEVRLPKRVPDPAGVRHMAGIAATAAVLFALLVRAAGGALWPAWIPLAWTSAEALLARILSRRVRPARVLKLEFSSLPDDWRTLVVTPVLLSDAARVETACDNLEALGCLDDDANIECLLLGDFADAEAAELPGDSALVEGVRARISAMNDRAGREKYHGLLRPRTLLAADGRYMGRDRKRGALMDLNRLLLGEAGAEEAFLPGRFDGLRGRFRCVVTLDADTRMLPGTVQKLVGAMAHPMNRPGEGRGWAVLQPRMEPLPSACVNAFVERFAGAGGVDCYPVAAANLWMDGTGVGVYAGKGIYEVAAFQAALEGALPEGRILSHDLIEGALARAAFLGDVALYDGSPATLDGWLKRLHRWTRGDWQLLPLLLRRGPLPNGRRLPAADRFRMVGNLLRSLRAPALWAALTASAWRGSASGIAAALLIHFLEPISHPLRRDFWSRAVAELAALPATALCQLDAALRALWRLAVSGRHLLDWVPSAEAEQSGRRGLPVGVLAAALLLPGLWVPGTALAALGLGLVFWAGEGWVRDMERAPAAEAEFLSEGQRAMLRALARDTWRFFERCVPLGGAALPPDNVQLDPPAPPVRRTSPTNAGLYLLSCVAAARLALISMGEARQRFSAALEALERCEKWHGHLYNWIDIDALQPLRPRYVSAVDSGNLAACAIACASALEGEDAALAGRLRALAEGMDFRALHDEEQGLFAIGVDAESGRRSEAHYDLLASESRILSYVAIALGQIPARHWRRLGRGCAAVDRRGTLLSWSGTMFEYLMPELLMRSPARSLLGESCRGAVSAQRVLGRRLNRPWGVSESGWHAFDPQMNYQYRAFGLRALALSGQARQDVVAPYAAALALAVCPRTAAENLKRMAALGWRGECGFFEAADYQNAHAEDGPFLVQSHMAHHQGMILCAACNALTEDSLAADFLADPRMRAFALLLEERPCPAPRRGRRTEAPECPRRPRRADWERAARTDGRRVDVHLLRGREAFAFATSDGGVHYSRNGFDATRFSGGLADRYDAACVRLADAETGEEAVLGGPGCRAVYDAGSARFARSLSGVRAELRVSLSPEDDTLFRAVRLRNVGVAPARLRVLDAVPAALARPEDWRSHPAFQNLFLEILPLGDRGLLLRRRPRNPGERCPVLAHLACAEGTLRRTGDLEALLARTGDLRKPDGVRWDFPEALGCTLNPASILCAEVEVAPGESVELHFALCLLESGKDVESWARRCAQSDAPGRAARLNRARTEAMLGYLGLTPQRATALDRLAALLLDGMFAAAAKAQDRPAGDLPRAALWSLGISGDRPVLTMFAGDPAQEPCARALLQAHAFYRAMGLEADLALVDDGEAGYARPCRDMLAGLATAFGLNGRERVPGGVWLLDGSMLTAAQRSALVRGAALVLDASADPDARFASMLHALERPGGGSPRPLDVGRSTLEPEARRMDNGFGGFGADGSYVIDVAQDRLPPVAWSNVLAGEETGMLLTERGGGFMWRGNSRTGRMTPWRGDALREGWGWMLTLVNARTGESLRLLPGDAPALPYRVRFSTDRAVYAFAADRLVGETTLFIDAAGDAAVIDVRLENRGLNPGDWQVVCAVRWRMGEEARDEAWLHRWAEGGTCFASGVMRGVGWLACSSAAAEPVPAGGLLTGTDGACGGLAVPLSLRRGRSERLRFAIGWAGSLESARSRARTFAGEAFLAGPASAPQDLQIDTPDEALNRMANGFLLHQVRSSRVMGRAGLYQPGGAWGFRDQLQDMLALIPSEPERVRAHLLRCAARQFEAGDVLHWWHAPYLGVRTRISDDRLFLPWVAAAYVRQTGDSGVLEEVVPYLEEVSIPEGQEDRYAEMRPGTASGTLHEHCMRALRATDHTGAHGLARMGAGDWNDGMNRVGAQGRGESVWLSEFLAACAEAYAGVAPETDRSELMEMAARHRAAVEACGWDGAWYRRAFADDGTPLGSAASKACRIDLIAQAWAVLAGLDGDRCAAALDAAWTQLVDEGNGLIRLLDPAFDGTGGLDPGYLRGYPPGVRENGAQYTHGACWLLLALIRAGDAGRAHRALRMLLPPCRADTPEKALRYRVEPYVTAADICALPGKEGRGGWTWYTGSAAWLYVCILELLGYERRGDRVRLRALLGEWPEVRMTLRFGDSTYRLTCERRARRVELDGRAVEEAFIRLVDDGGVHEATFPAR